MHFPSGMAGISIVLFALMGTIGVGYLLNGNTTYEPVDTYDYVTDVTGLYNYTPVTAYAPYSPAANNYQYATSIADLGTYTNGINYTEAGAANLNPIITPSSGTTVTTGTIDYADLPGDEVSARAVIALHTNPATNSIEGYWAPQLNVKLIPLRSLVDQIGDYTTISIPFSNLNAELNYTYDSTTYSDTYTIQPVGLYYAATATTYNDAINAAKDHYVTASGTNYYIAGSINSDISIDLPAISTQIRPHETRLVSNPVGVISSLTINPNGTATYNYTYNDVPTQRTVSIDTTTLIVFSNDYADSSATIEYTDTYTPQITYTKTIVVDIEYMDPNYGVSTSANTVYWNNGNDLGSVSILLKKPTNTTSQTFTMYHADDTAALAYTISYNGMTWTLSSSGSPINMGKGWEGILVTAYYTGELQWTPVKVLTNFTDYRLGNTNTIAAAVEGNEPISYCKITSSGQSFNFAVVGTSVASGSVPGAMYNATFTVTDYFPQYDDVRVSFDSAAYVGTSVQVGTWTMNVDSASFIGTFTGADGAERSADLTKPWAIIWTTADTVAVSYTPYNKMGTQTVTVLSADAAKVVTLNGQWVLDTDLYSISTHEEAVYNWNFGHWGLDKVPFIVCVMGLTAVLAIIYRITGVPFSGFDFAIIALANLVLWVIM